MQIGRLEAFNSTGRDLRVPSSVLQAHGGHCEVEEGFDIGTKRGAAMRVARWCGLLVGAKDPSKFHIVRLNLGKICQDLALEKGAKMSKLEGIALCSCKKVFTLKIST